MKDSYGREITYLRLSVTDRCNLRCRYCMPEEGICKKRHSEMLTEEEMILAVEAAASLGIRKLRITGGEPLIKKNIITICRRAAKVNGIEEVCLTTNALLLPEYAQELKKAGVSRINISLDTLDPMKYAAITRQGNIKDALRGLEKALDAGFEKIKVNSVLIGGFNEDEIPVLADLTRVYPIDVRFIELMPMVEGSCFGPEAYISTSHVLDKMPDLLQEEKDGGVARLYRLPGAQGRIGLISPMYAHFCASCNRIRLTADGKIKPCLHSHAEYSLKGLELPEMKQRMQEAILVKPEWHGTLSWKEQSHAERFMNQIGG